MKIHQSFLTHDGVSPNTAGKVIDLGFNGDFDYKKNEWNMVFVQFAGKATATSMTVTVYSKQEAISSITTSTNVIGTLTILSDKVQKGGVFGIRMPKGLKRYFTLGFSGATLPDVVTAGITDAIDTDTELDWTNYKAPNTGSSEVPEVREATTKDIEAHAAKTSGVHGL